MSSVLKKADKLNLSPPPPKKKKNKQTKKTPQVYRYFDIHLLNEM